MVLVRMQLKVFAACKSKRFGYKSAKELGKNGRKRFVRGFQDYLLQS